MTHVDINSRPRASGAAHPTEALAGLWVPLVTPLTQDGGLDERSLTQLVDHVIDGGADGLFLWGTTSEAASLGARMGRRVTACVMRRLASRRPSGFPCVVCVSDPCLETSIEMARYAWRFHEAGMIGVAATPPYYYPMNDEELRRYFETLSMATPAPVILYNFPDLAKTPLRADLVAELAELPGIV
ncbi:MAG: dihydrodipicolinate synthase family protein, partial [bacterium]